MSNLPTYPAIKKPDQIDPVARSIANPNAFAKPGAIGKTADKGVRFRPLAEKKVPGRQRKRKRDLRYVKFY